MTEARRWVTYRLADGEQIFGEYEWVSGPEFFEDVDRPTDVVKETWALISVETITFGAEDEDGDELAEGAA